MVSYLLSLLTAISSYLMHTTYIFDVQEVRKKIDTSVSGHMMELLEIYKKNSIYFSNFMVFTIL